ncbi:bifunctional phosphopantothenoylcysteine decarboxylase/phosphopantothenate--cysteine ligase CoaBC [Aureispira anguillae]|uniref:Coenzyme A biosynthesis bifunctional protein CoaBC n=1 Tax=Aureispira anguillae TaxID=2864201 RepID=A0A915YBA6_9BACT|nr:bifunctional phosphopantothenoylcysteine decarboxylase/phosphopantothenate--cysteine ligase CoaBC [Aureispira anguillae]BDS09915.1 bifunctional phosphopantothenoylcysteine decarboxylase/phosphopantothenate--cysteine ligase CoaBC [Aureispira anguillae]
MLSGKKILVAVSGSIAAYKIAILVRLLVKAKAEVKVIMTPAAKGFITPLTLSTLSKNPVYSDVSSEEGWNNHVDLGLWADAMVVAPATANTLAKMANGLCDNMLLAAYLSSRCPVFIAPAMDLDMWVHPSTQHNVQKLLSFGNHLLPVEDGELASGLIGKGRMSEPTAIVLHLEQFFALQNSPNLLAQKTVIITSGPTQEAIDPVRFISNHSTGKMGTAIADQMALQGAKVILISGPTSIVPKHPAVQSIPVRSAEEMYQKAAQYFPQADIAVLAAAVADYTPKTTADHKLKKKEGDLNIELKRTTDIAAALGQQKQAHQIMVGFALETNQALENAQRKLIKKNFDFIVLNDLKDKGAGFGHDTNKVTFVEQNGNIVRYTIKTKAEVAQDIVAKVIDLLPKA